MVTTTTVNGKQVKIRDLPEFPWPEEMRSEYVILEDLPAGQTWDLIAWKVGMDPMRTWPLLYRLNSADYPDPLGIPEGATVIVPMPQLADDVAAGESDVEL